MLGSSVFEVATGLIFVYLILSIGCSGIKEVVASVFDMRGKTLEQAIRNMLKDDKATAELFSHPLVSAMSQPGKRPSYISSRNFALALIDVVAPLSNAQPRTAQDLRNGISNLPDAALRQTVLGFVDSSQGDLDAARAKIEHWYDDTMDRVTGWYKRKAQLIIFITGLLLCAGLNADTMMIVKELWSDQAIRTVVVAQAQTALQTLGAAGGEAHNFAQIAGQISSANAPPIGWSEASESVRAFPKGVSARTLKLLGILISTIAVTLGAPFWFDLLNTIINLRLTGDRPPTSPR